MAVTYVKIKYEDLEESTRESVTSFTDKEVTFDDSKISAAEKTKLSTFLVQSGYEVKV